MGRKRLLKKIPHVKFEKVPRAFNGKADALARLAKELADPNQEEIQILVRSRRLMTPMELAEDEEMLVDNVTEGACAQEQDWRQPFIQY